MEGLLLWKGKGEGENRAEEKKGSAKEGYLLMSNCFLCARIVNRSL